MTLIEAQITCREIDARKGLKPVKWNNVFKNENEIVEALKQVYIPRNRTAPPFTFIGYAYIYSFAFYVQKGWELSKKQMEQCKRIAIEIKKAAAISSFQF